MLHRRRHSLVEGCSDRARRAAAMKGAVGRGSNGVATDLLVCFPSRAHLALMPPKTIVCSPSRPSAAGSEPAKRRRSTSRPSALSKSATAARNSQSRRAAAAADAPVDNDEPSSPKVTCVGQIKSARPAKPRDGGGGGKRKKATWLQALGIKNADGAVPFLDALHGAFRFNLRGCFGGFPGSAVGYTSDEDDDDEEEDEPRAEKEAEHGAALARWFMVLEEGKKVSGKRQGSQGPQQKEGGDAEDEEAAPPANALMLMRCRSAPAKGLARRLGVEEATECDDAKSPEAAEEKEQESLVVMSYSPDFFKVSLDVVKETWIVGGDDAVLRCRSWKR